MSDEFFEKRFLIVKVLIKLVSITILLRLFLIFINYNIFVNTFLRKGIIIAFLFVNILSFFFLTKKYETFQKKAIYLMKSIDSEWKNLSPLKKIIMFFNILSIPVTLFGLYELFIRILQ